MISGKMRVAKELGAVVAIILALVLMSGCSFIRNALGPSYSDYIGVWACYAQQSDDGEFKPESIAEVLSFLVLSSNGRAEIVVRLPGEEPRVVDCAWDVVFRDRDQGDDAGVVLVGEDFAGSCDYIYYPDETFLADESLIDGILCIDYGYRRDYFEKVSDDPDYQPWLVSSG